MPRDGVIPHAKKACPLIRSNAVPKRTSHSSYPPGLGPLTHLTVQHAGANCMHGVCTELIRGWGFDMGDNRQADGVVQSSRRPANEQYRIGKTKHDVV